MRDSGRSKRQKLKKLITSLKEERSQLSAKIEKFETKLMAKCPHPLEALRAGNFIASSGFGYATPDMRVCTDCGHAEEGWGSGYWKLRTDYSAEIPSMSRDAAFKFVRKFWTQDAMDEFRYPKHDTV